MAIEQRPSPLRYAGQPSEMSRGDTTNLADLLERILDKGIVIAGDISISLVDVELLTIKLRLLIASVDKAQEMGVDWWRSDPWLSSRAAEQQGELGGGGDRELEGGGRTGRQSRSASGGRSAGDNQELADRLDRLEAAIDRLQETSRGGGSARGASKR